MKKALVTGGTKGLGSAIMAELQARGMETQTFARSLGYDLSNTTGISRAILHTGHVDVLVNCVGGGGRYGSMDEVMHKNVYAMIAFTNHVVEGMAKRGWGRVITISSIHGREYGSRPVFMAAKAAQIAYMKGQSRSEYVRRGVTFNTVCPGNVTVEGKPDLTPEQINQLPMGRMGWPQEVASLVAYLCSDSAAWVNGSCITVDGGESYAI